MKSISGVFISSLADVASLILQKNCLFDSKIKTFEARYLGDDHFGDPT
ncbi:hypothetical protein [Coxiella-like endosymbiont]|nr:hypothetical protein [Coxiella-like endosymbiont]